MTPQGFLGLAAQSVTAPQEVARLLLSLRLSREALILAFALVVVLNALFFGLSLVATGTGAANFAALNPVIFGVTLAMSLGGTILALTWAGRGLGGTARAADMAVLVIWLQALRVLVQAAMLVLVPLSAGLAGVVAMLASAVGVWILVNFIETAHGLGSLFKALMVLLLGLIGLGLALGLLFSLLGVDLNGMAGYV